MSEATQPAPDNAASQPAPAAAEVPAEQAPVPALALAATKPKLSVVDTDQAAAAAVAELQAQLAAQREQLEAMQAQIAEERAAAELARQQARAQRRAAFLSGINGGLHSESYLALAPADADADTAEGKAALAEWSRNNPALFRGVHGTATPQPAQFQPQNPTFAGRAIYTFAQMIAPKGGQRNG